MAQGAGCALASENLPASTPRAGHACEVMRRCRRCLPQAPPLLPLLALPLLPLQVLYERGCDYLELDRCSQQLDNRYGCVQGWELCRAHAASHPGPRARTTSPCA